MKTRRHYSIDEILEKNREIYQIPDDRLYAIDDILFNHQKFIFLLGDKLNPKKENLNLDIAASWFLTLVNRYHLDLEKKLWQRYSYKCPHCLEIPCYCSQNETKSQKTGRPGSGKPKTLDDWQGMFQKIYPDKSIEPVFERFLQNLNNLIFIIRHFSRKKTKFAELEKTCIDHFALILRLYNVAGLSLSKNFNQMFENGCYVCHKTPCICNYYE